MKPSVCDRLLHRELGDKPRYSSVLAIYGDRKWINDMDIINELDGHSGCVNALSWSKSGRLLASGSDDHHVNLHKYLPESSSAQFELATTILTGHSRNIFSVKFMPYSNDRTIVTATDDVRIFDIEYAGRSTESAYATRAGRAAAGLHGFPDGVRVLTEGDTNAKVFSSHSDTVKRIVTEDSPFYFLTCSEDGDVRQWDIRQPSSAYPAPRDGMLARWGPSSNGSGNVPPPLISYKRYNLDLNTVSCSPSQPHYIALGGAHLHCFLHDRRMLGRDKLAERGATLPSPSNWSDHDNELFGQATRCVRKFAPNGQKRMRRRDNGHITACKISDANPNEIVVSWSGDWIYSFDLINSPDATESSPEPSNVVTGDTERRVRDRVRKRKRPKSASTSNREGIERGGSRPRTGSSHDIHSDPNEELSLRVRWGNGQSEELRIQPADPEQLIGSDTAVEADTEHFRVAKYTVKIRKHMFDLGPRRSPPLSSDPTGHGADFSSILGFASIALPEMDETASSWRYPLNPNEVEVALQNKLRDWRGASRRFVQAAGTLARVLGGKMHSRNADALMGRYFTTITPAPAERHLPRHEQFGYDFLKAILLWLDSGIGALVDGFSSSGATSQIPIKPSSRFPIRTDSSIDAIDDILIPYLLQLASDDPVVNVDVSRFEHDSTRILFSSEKAAVLRFAQALKLPFADLSSALVPSSSSEGAETLHEFQDRKEALLYWAFRVGRGVLMNAAKNIDFALVDRAFGGSGRPDAYVRAVERSLRERQEDIDPLEEDEAVIDAELANRAWAEETSERSTSPLPFPEAGLASQTSGEGEPSTVEDGPDDDEDDEEQAEDDEVEEEENDDGSDSDGDIDPDDDDEDEGEELQETRSGRVLWRSEFDRSRHRERVEANVPCAPHTRQYTGHCNVRTVKDVNFFGLQDEYVVSGSDSGHVFIWDRKTSQLLNILEGDGETVNVVQGHPYEPTMAVSGIDHTIKIFSPDPRAQLNARKGIGVRPSDPSTFSSLGLRRRRRQAAENEAQDTVPATATDDDEGEQTDEAVAPNGLPSKKRMHQEYQITSKNDVDRKGGNRDAFITRFLLAQLARRVNGHPDDGNGGEEGGPIYIDENEDCTVM